MCVIVQTSMSPTWYDDKSAFNQSLIRSRMAFSWQLRMAALNVCSSMAEIIVSTLALNVAKICE